VSSIENADAPRRIDAGRTTRMLLMETAERLIAERGVEGVTLREIRIGAGQSNTSVISYHFGSKAGLISALIEHRNQSLLARRARVMEEFTKGDAGTGPRSVVWLVVAPLIESIREGEMFVPFLARLSEDPQASTAYWPDNVEDLWTSDVLEHHVHGVLEEMPPRVRRGRTSLLYNSILNMLGEQARSGRRLSEMQLQNFVDAWVGMLTAPVSDDTSDLLTS
jgi:AcrR family transcriptional regulator